MSDKNNNHHNHNHNHHHSRVFRRARRRLRPQSVTPISECDIRAAFVSMVQSVVVTTTTTTAEDTPELELEQLRSLNAVLTILRHYASGPNIAAQIQTLTCQTILTAVVNTPNLLCALLAIVGRQPSPSDSVHFAAVQQAVLRLLSFVVTPSADAAVNTGRVEALLEASDSQVVEFLVRFLRCPDRHHPNSVQCAVHCLSCVTTITTDVHQLVVAVDAVPTLIRLCTDPCTRHLTSVVCPALVTLSRLAATWTDPELQWQLGPILPVLHTDLLTHADHHTRAVAWCLLGHFTRWSPAAFDIVYHSGVFMGHFVDMIRCPTTSLVGLALKLVARFMHPPTQSAVVAAELLNARLFSCSTCTCAYCERRSVLLEYTCLVVARLEPTKLRAELVVNKIVPFLRHHRQHKHHLSVRVRRAVCGACRTFAHFMGCSTRVVSRK